MLHGIDVSNNNGRVSISGKDFMVAKATEGTNFRDSLFTYFWDAAKSHGMLRGAYHFMDTSNPVAQAKLFVDTVKAATMLSSDMLVLDAEEPALTNSAITACVRNIEVLSDKNVVIYTNYNLIRLGRFAGLYDYPLWIANPGGTIGSPTSVKPFPVWTMQQYSWDVIDADVFNGDKATWEKIVNIKAPGVLPAPKELTLSESPVVTFNWKFVEGASEYQIQVTDKAGKVVHDQMVPHSQAGVLLNNDTHYTWRVKSSPNGTWTLPAEFKTR